MRHLKFVWVAMVALVLMLQVAVGTALAVDVDENYRTIKLNPEGETFVLSNQQLEKGKRLFIDTCSQCHMAGRTKTNPNVTLKQTDLEGAQPPRDSVVAIVDYLNNPTSYDGEVDMSELHPSTKRADLYPEMRKYSQEDLKEVAGYILVQPKLQGIMWGGGKVFN